ncbi:MAG TPA: ATP-binding protein [Anaeromyxobacteraceae bacterium]|nr:ATP-binding protein [Anaeromyxobacteraceae bacterium]
MLRERYPAALRRHLAGGGEAALEEAYRLGRGALASGVGLLELVALHDQALLELARGAGGLARALPAASGFLAECLSPFQMAQREFIAANAALRRSNEALEEEARRIGRSLHDQAGQLLVAVHLALEELALAAPPDAHRQVAAVRRLLDDAQAQLRRLSHELCPPELDALGLRPALESLAGGVEARARLRISVEGGTGGRLPPAVETALYRVVQEGLANVVRHAHARAVRVALRRRDGRIRCTVLDDGAGFDPGRALAPGAAGLGVAGMRERVAALNGRLELRSRPGRGTRLAVSIPVPR